MLKGINVILFISMKILCSDLLNQDAFEELKVTP